jgi:3'-5' exoribonuclease
VNLYLLLQQTPPEAEPVHLALDFQIGVIRRQSTRTGKPYLELEIADGTGREKIKIWADTPAFHFCEEFHGGEAVHGSGRFSRNTYGLNVEDLQLRLLTKEEMAEFFAGSAERMEFLNGEFGFIEKTVAAFQDPRLKLLCRTFLDQYGDRFKRAAAAKEIHHARRGGLLEHTAQMMKTAAALAPVYPQMNWELVCSGVLFHDCGKLWENDYAEHSFVSHPQVVGELLGHISIGIELVNKLWRTLESTPEFQEKGTPSSETVRQHLLHLIASHHGQKEYGAPVTPRTPEGWALHYIDNLDARVEMMRAIYADKPLIAPGIHDHKRPMEGHAVTPLGKWEKA